MIPNTTQVPNIIIDRYMNKLSDTELRILLIIVRKTFGWIEDKETGMRKTEDWISRSQLQVFSGRHTQAVSAAIQTLQQLGLIEIRDSHGSLLKTPEERRGKRLFYRFTTSMIIKQVDQNMFENQSLIIKHTKETNTKELSTNVDNYQRTGKGDFEKVNGYGKPEVNQILKEFCDLTGLSKAIDKDPRFWAWQFARNKKMGVGHFKGCLKYLQDKWGGRVDLSKLETVYRHFPEYERDVLEKAKQRTIKKVAFEEDGSILVEQ